MTERSSRLCVFVRSRLQVLLRSGVCLCEVSFVGLVKVWCISLISYIREGKVDELQTELRLVLRYHSMYFSFERFFLSSRLHVFLSSAFADSDLKKTYKQELRKNQNHVCIWVLAHRCAAFAAANSRFFLSSRLHVFLSSCL